jgi:hypothetical protein
VGRASGLGDTEAEVRLEVDGRDVTAELRNASCELGGNVSRLEHRQGHVDRCSPVLGTTRRQPLLVVKPKRIDEVRIRTSRGREIGCRNLVVGDD